MTWLRRVRPALLRFSLYLIGVAVMIGSLLGAKLLTGGHDENAKAESSGGNPSKIAGPLVLGTVDSNPQPIPCGLPPVLQSGTILKIYVKDGDEIHAGDKLYVFDTSSLQGTLGVAQCAVEVAKTKVAEAKQGVIQHAKKVNLQEQAIKIANTTKESKADYYRFVERNLKEYYSKEQVPMDKWDAKLKNDDKLFAAQIAYSTALSEWELKQSELNALQEGAKTADIMVTQAEAVVKQAEAEVARAQKTIDLCTIRAKIDGTIEQVTISEGSTLGISTPKPALWLIPAGPRVVRAEIEADFAHCVSSSLEGKEVTIYDNADPKMTYKGKVRRVGEAFLPKRSSEGLLGSDTLVLPALIEVSDAKPANRPPLRIGQRVRVDLGQ
jgi:multidrug resistance efflux pump